MFDLFGFWAGVTLFTVALAGIPLFFLLLLFYWTMGGLPSDARSDIYCRIGRWCREHGLRSFFDPRFDPDIAWALYTGFSLLAWVSVAILIDAHSHTLVTAVSNMSAAISGVMAGVGTVVLLAFVMRKAAVVVYTIHQKFSAVMKKLDD